MIKMFWFYCMNCKKNFTEDKVIYSQITPTVKCPNCDMNEFKVFYKYKNVYDLIEELDMLKATEEVSNKDD